MKDEKKIAIVGFGGMGNWHREVIETIEGIKLSGVVDIDEKRKEYARSLLIPVYENLEAVLRDDDIDIILVSTPNDVHREIAIAAMEAGKHVVCEKPVALNSSELAEMIDTSKKTGRFLTVHQNRRWDEDYLTMNRIYQEGTLGEVYRIESRVHGSRGIPGDWRQKKEYGGGMVLDWGVHMLDQILLMLQGHKLKTVFATLTNVTNQLVDDGFTALMTFDNNVEVLVEVGTSNFITLPRWYMLGQNGTAVIHDWELNGEIVYAAGKSEKDVTPVRTAAGLTKTMAPRRKDTVHKEELPVIKSDIKDFYKNVIAVIDGKEKTKIKLSEVMRVMKLMEAIFESASKNQVIPFE